jgi:hypothetical protein
MSNKIKSKGNIIDLSQWVTQAEYASKTGYKLGTISQWVKRAKDGKPAKIDYIDVPEIGITLVKKA